mgnify:CR=1 FL=1|tara:strand:+ start:1041 stop:1304 length:264 start_codon:yes stop_codon:yes gene_type:complete
MRLIVVIDSHPFLLNYLILFTQLSKGINNNTEDDVEQDDNDYKEESAVVQDAEPTVRILPPASITKTEYMSRVKNHKQRIYILCEKS